MQKASPPSFNSPSVGNSSAVGSPSGSLLPPLSTKRVVFDVEPTTESIGNYANDANDSVEANYIATTPSRGRTRPSPTNGAINLNGVTSGWISNMPGKGYIQVDRSSQLDETYEVPSVGNATTFSPVGPVNPGPPVGNATTFSPALRQGSRRAVSIPSPVGNTNTFPPVGASTIAPLPPRSFPGQVVQQTGPNSYRYPPPDHSMNDGRDFDLVPRSSGATRYVQPVAAAVPKPPAQQAINPSLNRTQPMMTIMPMGQQMPMGQRFQRQNQTFDNSADWQRGVNLNQFDPTNDALDLAFDPDGSAFPELQGSGSWFPSQDGADPNQNQNQVPDPFEPTIATPGPGPGQGQARRRHKCRKHRQRSKPRTSRKRVSEESYDIPPSDAIDDIDRKHGMTRKYVRESGRRRST